MAVNIDDIESGILVWLRTDPQAKVTPAMHTYLKTIDSYQGQFEEDQLPRVPDLLPAAYVIFREAPYRPLSNLDQEADFIFSIFLVSQTFKGNEEARFGIPGVLVGVYQMIEDLRKLLVGATFGLPNFTPMLFQHVGLFKNTQALSIYDVQVVTQYHVIPQGE